MICIKHRGYDFLVSAILETMIRISSNDLKNVMYSSTFSKELRLTPTAMQCK